jgi:hypothetical protein
MTAGCVSDVCYFYNGPHVTNYVETPDQVKTSKTRFVYKEGGISCSGRTTRTMQSPQAIWVAGRRCSSQKRTCRTVSGSCSQEPEDLSPLRQLCCRRFPSCHHSPPAAVTLSPATNPPCHRPLPHHRFPHHPSPGPPPHHQYQTYLDSVPQPLSSLL